MADSCLIKDWMEPDMPYTMREKGPLCLDVLETNTAMQLIFFYVAVHILGSQEAAVINLPPQLLLTL